MQNRLSTVGLARDYLAAGTKAALLMKLADAPEVLARAARDDCPTPTPDRLLWSGSLWLLAFGVIRSSDHARAFFKAI